MWSKNSQITYADQGSSYKRTFQRGNIGKLYAQTKAANTLKIIAEKLLKIITPRNQYWPSKIALTSNDTGSHTVDLCHRSPCKNPAKFFFSPYIIFQIFLLICVPYHILRLLYEGIFFCSSH